MLIILIFGASGAGKTTLSNKLMESLNAITPHNAQLMSMDNYYHGCPAGISVDVFRAQTNFTELETIDVHLLISHLEQLRRGEPILHPVYDFESSTRRGIQTLPPAPFIIVEGILAYRLRDELERRSMSVFTVEVKLSSYQALIRQRAKRDLESRHREPEMVRLQESKYLGPAHFFSDLSHRHNVDISIDPCTESLNESVDNIITMTQPFVVGARP